MNIKILLQVVNLYRHLGITFCFKTKVGNRKGRIYKEFQTLVYFIVFYFNYLQIT